MWVDKYGDYLYRHAYARVGNKATAESIVQETFLAGIKGIQNFEGKSTVKTWLLSILKNKVTDRFRKVYREPKQVSASDSDQGDIVDEYFYRSGIWKKWIPSWAETPDDALERKKLIEVLESCIKKLPARMREVYILKSMDNKTTEELCEDLEISSSNLWVMIYRARMHLRECLEKNWYNK